LLPGAKDIFGAIEVGFEGIFFVTAVGTEDTVIVIEMSASEFVKVVVFVDVGLGDELVLSVIAIVREPELELSSGIRLIVESPRTDPTSVALTISSSPESTISSVAKARSENQFSFRDLCEAADVSVWGVGSRLEGDISSFR
jgi:hypothetical protein